MNDNPLAGMSAEERRSYIETYHLNEDGTPPELHEDLQPFITRLSFGWDALKHPLLFHIPYDPFMAGLANKQYEHKLECLDMYARARNLHGYCAAYERPYRIEAFTYLVRAFRDMEANEYWELLRWVWTDSENVWQNLALWKSALKGMGRFGGRDRQRHFMDEEERDTFATMVEAAATWEEAPGHFEVWRGTSAPNQMGSGLSWTFDRKKAIWFAQRFANVEGNRWPYLLRGLVPTKRVIGFIEARNEKEVVVADKKHVQLVETIPLELTEAK